MKKQYKVIVEAPAEAPEYWKGTIEEYIKWHMETEVIVCKGVISVEEVKEEEDGK